MGFTQTNIAQYCITLTTSGYSGVLHSFWQVAKKFWKYRKPILQWKNTFEAGFLLQYWKLSQTAPMHVSSYRALPTVNFSEFLKRCLWWYLALKLIILFLTNHAVCIPTLCFRLHHDAIPSMLSAGGHDTCGGHVSGRVSHFACEIDRSGRLLVAIHKNRLWIWIHNILNSSVISFFCPCVDFNSG